ncbi:TrmB family transcriptional regulator [Pectinatus cerevisiiphilus]|uniref:Sugar-specific transcriptional regulator TrmB n=1 Tax=Pectinatus cerevisiiphilus TaxID=86956 RepID=A0A4R3KEB2_9FIRM|nr:TrmB family transcriptional regulator [Pectinatus cerevisiiphilus]TCS81425.1 sugar-specific transcriptional regulator TrmB [Pectinatus cerevisiiphilus]
MDTDILAVLQRLDFTEYEAKAYLALLEKAPLSGYAVALNSGVPRSKVYEVLGGLEKRGVVLVNHENTALYSPLPPQQLLAKKKRYAEKCFSIAEKTLKNYPVVLRHRENIWDIKGSGAIINKAEEIIDRARHRILLEICPEEAEIVKKKLKMAANRGVEVTIVALGEVSLNFAHVYSHDSIDKIYAEYGGRWLILSVDDKEILAGIVSLGAESRAATTTHPGLVMPITEEIIHDLYIGEILKKHRDILEESFGPDLVNLRKKYNMGPEAVKQWLSIL